MSGDRELPLPCRISQERFLPQARCARCAPLPAGCFRSPGEALCPRLRHFPIDPATGAIGRRPSGAPLYHRGSQFGPPERRKLDRNMRVRLLHLATALDRRTRQKGQHGGILKRTGIEVLRQLLFTLPEYADRRVLPEPSSRSPRPLGAASRRCGKRFARWRQPASFRRCAARWSRPSRAGCIGPGSTSRCRTAIRTCSTCRCPIGRPKATLLCRCFGPSEADAKSRHETNQEILNKLPADLAAALEGLGHAINYTD